jgi:penicillin-binding protein 1A
VTKAPKPKAAKKADKPRVSGWLLRAFFAFCVAGTFLASAGVLVVYWHFSRGLPKIIEVGDYRPKGITRILGGGGREDQLLGEFSTERRYLVPYEKIPEVVVRAFISAEDDKFFEHPGINVVSMIRAAIANFRAGHTVQGGSTITQQVAKSLLLTGEKTFERKIKEIILAGRIEKNLTKQQILYLYLNQIYLGHSAYGVQAATKTYFHKDVGAISLAEAALLAGLPQAPSKYSPLVNPKRAKERQLYVLRRMFENRYITQVQMTDAAAQPLKLYPEEDINHRYAAYLVEYIRKYLVDKYGETAVNEEGLTVAVPATRERADAARKSLRDGLAAVDKRIGWRGPVQKLGSGDEIEKFLRELRARIIQTKIGYTMFLPDGKDDQIEAMRAEGFQGDTQLLDVGEIYQAVVMSTDDRRKTASVLIGAVRAEIPWDKMKWAKPPRDEKNPASYRPEPRSPSAILSHGDVVLVRVEDKTNGIVAGLEQAPQIQGAVFSLEAQTGNVLAMEGGYEFKESEFNRAVQALRQPGSAFKPIIYSSALEKGYTPATIIVDSPVVYDDSVNGKWKPSNYEEKFYGDTTFRQALIHSRNIPTIKIVQALQIPYVIDYAKRLGFDAKFNNDLSISLGSASISLQEITRTYALFPRLGRRVTPIFISRVADRDGRVLEEQKPVPMPSEAVISSAMPESSPGPSPVPSGGALPSAPTPAGLIGRSAITMPTYPAPGDPDQVLDPRVAYVMTHLMKEVVAYGTGRDAKALGRVAAGKTGTTNDSIDAWFMGFTPHVVTGVWVGFDNQKSIGPGETGAKAALPIWLGYMRDAVKNYPDVDFTIPPGVVFASIDPTTGKLAASNSSRAIREAFLEGTQPVEAGVQSSDTPDQQSEFFKEDIE